LSHILRGFFHLELKKAHENRLSNRSRLSVSEFWRVLPDGKPAQHVG
jgi:hypothetical protein